MKISIDAIAVTMTMPNGSVFMFPVSLLDDSRRLITESGPLAAERVKTAMTQVDAVCFDAVKMTVYALLAKVALDAYRETLPNDFISAAIGRML